MLFITMDLIKSLCNFHSIKIHGIVINRKIMRGPIYHPGDGNIILPYIFLGSACDFVRTFYSHARFSSSRI